MAAVVVLLCLFVAAGSLGLTVLYRERQQQRRELHRRLIVHAAEQRMRQLDQVALSSMFDAARRRSS